MGVEHPCRMCNGTGSVSVGKGAEKTCPNCGGDGYIGYIAPAGVCAFFCPLMKGIQ